MAGLSGIVVETPTLATPNTAKGPITTLASYRISRRINAAGSWALAFPASEVLASSIVTGWRISLTQEGNDSLYPGWLLRRGVVKRHSYAVDISGQGILTLQGITPMGVLGETFNHIGLAFTSNGLSTIAAGIAPGYSFTVPGRTSSQLMTVTFSEQTQLAELLRCADFFRCNFREQIGSATAFDFRDTDDVPDSGYRFVQHEASPTDTPAALAAAGVGVIAGVPSVDTDGGGIVNRITPIGADWDGGPLTLQYSTKSSPYPIKTAVGPDGATYYFIEAVDSINRHGLIESQLARSDVKNPNNPAADAGASRRQAANVLYAVAVGNLLQRGRENITFGCQIANGESVWALPGDRVRVRYTGKALQASGPVTWQNIDQDFLITSRDDTSSISGGRLVTFSLASYAPAYTIPPLPTAIPIPTPYDPPRSPPKPKDKEDNKRKPEPPPRREPPEPNDYRDPGSSPTNYAPCCGHPGVDWKDGPPPLPAINDPPLNPHAIPSSGLYGFRYVTTAAEPNWSTMDFNGVIGPEFTLDTSHRILNIFPEGSIGVNQDLTTYIAYYGDGVINGGDDFTSAWYAEKFDSTGVRLWTKQFGSDSFYSVSVSAGSNGTVVILWDISFSEHHLEVYDHAGLLLASKLLTAGVDDEGSCSVDSTGAVYFSGGFGTTNIRKFSADLGTTLWSVTPDLYIGNDVDTLSDTPWTIAQIPGVFRYTVRKVNAATGATVSSFVADPLLGLITIRGFTAYNNRVYIQTNGPATSTGASKQWIIAYDSSGVELWRTELQESWYSPEGVRARRAF